MRPGDMRSKATDSNAYAHACAHFGPREQGQSGQVTVCSRFRSLARCKLGQLRRLRGCSFAPWRDASRGVAVGWLAALSLVGEMAARAAQLRKRCGSVLRNRAGHSCASVSNCCGVVQRDAALPFEYQCVSHALDAPSTGKTFYNVGHDAAKVLVHVASSAARTQ